MVLLTAVAAWSSAFGEGTEDNAQSLKPATGRDAEVFVQSYEPMKHPGPFNDAGEGVVVIQVELDRAGEPTVARALSGPRLLVEPALQNVRAMKFAAGPTDAMILFDFRVADACFGTGSWVAGRTVTSVGCARNY
jgi:hypothetical protein